LIFTGGGIDLIFPHHENEIAQSEAANGKAFAKIWMHNNFINMGKEKMSKSLGNVFQARQFLDRYNGEILKFLILSVHYRSPADFGFNVISHATHGLARVYSSLCAAHGWLEKCKNQGYTAQPLGVILDAKNFGGNLETIWSEVGKACDDDFNTPEVMAKIFNLIRSFNSLLKAGTKPSQELANSCERFITQIKSVGALMALFQQSPESFLRELDDMLLGEKNLKRDEIQNWVTLRIEARRNKEFKTSDEIRDRLQQMGIELRDSPEGTEWEVKK